MMILTAILAWGERSPSWPMPEQEGEHSGREQWRRRYAIAMAYWLLSTLYRH